VFAECSIYIYFIKTIIVITMHLLHVEFNMKKTKPSDEQMCYTKICDIYITLNIFVTI